MPVAPSSTLPPSSSAPAGAGAAAAAAPALAAPTSLPDDDAVAPKLTMSSCTTEIVRGMHLFNVDQYSLIKDLGVGDFVRSGTFPVGEHSWAILFYPSGSEAAAATGGGGKLQHYVSVYLELLTPNVRDVRVRFDLSVIDSFGRMRSLFREDNAATKDRRWRHAVFSTVPTAAGAKLPSHHPPRCWGVSSFDASELETPAYVQDGQLTLRCDVRVIKPPHVSVTRQLRLIDAPPPCLSKDLGKLLEDKDGADVTVLVRGEHFSAHRALLAGRSPVLRTRLRDSSTAADQPCTITIQDVRPAVFKAMLRFIYTDELPLPPPDEDADAETVRELYVAAERYGMERLKRVCESKLCGGLNKATLAATAAFAGRHGCEKLRAACLEFYMACSPRETAGTYNYKRLMSNPPGSINLETSKRHKTSYIT